MKFNMIIVAILVLRFLVKLRFPANNSIRGIYIKLTFLCGSLQVPVSQRVARPLSVICSSVDARFQWMH